jgi:hypothetical protein
MSEPVKSAEPVKAPATVPVTHAVQPVPAPHAAAPAAILVTASNRLAAAYYGTATAAVDPAIISLLMSFLTSLLGGCTPAATKAELARPRIARTRIYLHVAAGAAQTGEAIDVQAATDAIFAVGTAASEAEITAYKSAVPSQS